MSEQLDRLALPSGNALGPNCGVTAVAIAANISFAKAWETLAPYHKPNGRKPWRGETTVSSRLKALDELGVDYTAIPLRPASLTSVVRSLRPGTLAMVRTTQHVQVVLNGFVVDQRGRKPIAEYWGRNKRATHITIINES